MSSIFAASSEPIRAWYCFPVNEADTLSLCSAVEVFLLLYRFLYSENSSCCSIIDRRNCVNSNDDTVWLICHAKLRRLSKLSTVLLKKRSIVTWLAFQSWLSDSLHLEDPRKEGYRDPIQQTPSALLKSMVLSMRLKLYWAGMDLIICLNAFLNGGHSEKRW